MSAATPLNIEQINSEYAAAHPQELLRLAARSSETLALSFSGAEDVALIEMIRDVQPAPRVFTLNTGRLHAETLAFIDRVQDHYGIEIEHLHPDPAAIEALVRDKGAFSFYEDGHEECCSIRKIEPLRRHLESFGAWITGQRRDQSPTRAHVPLVQVDTAFSTEARPLIKFNPLAAWTSEEVWAFIRERGLPYNELHDRGYASIGCEPCTRAIKPGEHERAGRWWWEEATQRECGLHIINVQTPEPKVSRLA